MTVFNNVKEIRCMIIVSSVSANTIYHFRGFNNNYEEESKGFKHDSLKLR